MSIKDIRKKLNGGGTQGSQDYRRSSLSTPSSRSTPMSGGTPPPVSRGPSAPVKPNVDEEMQDIRKLQAERSRINLEAYKREQEVKNNINRLSQKGQTVGALEEKPAQTYTEKGIDAIRKRLIEPVTQALYGSERTPMPSVGSQIGQVGDKVFGQTLPLGNGNLEKFVTGLTSAGPGMERTFGHDITARQVASKPGQYGQLAQNFLPGAFGERAAATAFAEAPRVINALGRGVIGGITGTAGSELQAEGRTPLETLLNLGLGGSLGGVIGGGGSGIVQGAGAIRNAYREGIGALEGLNAGDLASGGSRGVNQAYGMNAPVNVPQGLALPGQVAREQRPLGNFNAAQTPDVIYQPETGPRGLPEPSKDVVTSQRQATQARNGIEDIDNEINDLNSRYQQAVTEHFNFLKQQRNSRAPLASKGGLIRDTAGEVTGAFPSVSSKPDWLIEFNRANNYRQPTNKELYEIAQRHINEGYIDGGHNVPSWKEQNAYDETIQSLNQIKDSLRSYIPEVQGTSGEYLSPQSVPKFNRPPEPVQPTLIGRKPKAVQTTSEPSQTPTTPIQKVRERIKAQAAEQPQQPAQETAPQPITEQAAQTPGEVPQGQSRFATKTIPESGAATDELRQALGQSDNLKYNKASNEAQVARANEILSTQGAERSINDLIAKSQTQPFTGDDTALAIRSIQEIQKTDIEKAVTMAEVLSQRLTKAGQEIQASYIMDRLSPEGQLVRLTRAAQDIGKKVETADAEAVRNFAEAAQKSGQSVERSGTVMDIAEKLRKDEELSPEELAELHTFVEDMKQYIKPAKEPKPKKVKLPSEKKIRENLLNSLNEKEAQLKEFIRKNSRRVSSTPFDLWGAYAALGAIKLAKGTISFSKWSSEMLADVGEEIRPKLAQLFDKSQQEADQLEHMLPSKIQAAKVADKYVKAGKLTPHDAILIHNLAARVGRMGSDERYAAQREIQGILNKYTKSSIEDKANAIRYIDMLANTSTQLVNAVSSPLMILERQLVNMALTPFDIARSAITGGERRITFKQGPGVWDSFFTPASDYVKGAKVGGESGWKGIDPMGITTQTDTKGLAWRSKWNPFRWAEGGLGAVMKGADYASYNTAVKMKLRQMAYMDALNKGIKGKDEIRRYMDRYLNNVDSNIIEMADKFGKEATFQTRTKASEGAQQVARGFNLVSTLGASNKIGLGSALVPFAKTPTNILLGGLERTPLGVVKGLYQLATMSKNPNITGADVATTFANALLGTAGLSGTGYVLGNLGILTGDSSSKSKDVQALEQDIGKGKFKFNTSAFSRMMGALIHGNMDEVREVSKYRPGDKQLNYSKLQPFAFPVSMGATFAEQQRQDKSAEARGGNIPLGEQLKAAGIAGGQSLFDMSLLKGLKDAFDTQPGEGVGDIAGRIASGYAKSFSPSALAQEQRRQDESQRVVPPGSVKEYFASRSPAIPLLGVEGSKSLPPKVTRMGDTLKNERGVIANYLNPLQRNTPNYNQASQFIYDLIQKTGDETIAPKVFDKTLRVTKNGKTTTVTIPAQRYATAQQEVGREITKRILEIPKDATTEEAVAQLETIIKEVETAQRDKLKGELGLVAPKVR